MKNLNISLQEMRKLTKNTLQSTKYKLTGTKTGYPSIDKTHEKGASFFKRHPIIPNVSIYDAISMTSKPYRTATALDCGEIKLTYQELLDYADTLSKSYEKLGVGEGDIVTIVTPNISQAVIAFLAANKIGAIGTFLNSESSVDEIKYYLNLFNSPLLINYDRNKEYNQMLKRNNSLKHIITLSSQDLNTKGFNRPQGNQTFDDYLNYRDMKLFEDLKQKAKIPKMNGNKPAVILFTSGTTGNPKSVVLTNKNVLASGTYMKNSCELKQEVGEKTLVCVPFCYPYGFITSTIMSLLCGREAILAPDLSAEKIGDYLEKQPNIIFGSPAMLELVKRNVKEDQDLSSVDTFISGGDFLPKEKSVIAKQFFKDHGANVEICNGSGNAETVGASTNSVGVKNRPETVGKVLTGEKSIIIDPETKKEMKYGETGTYFVAGKNVFQGYYGQPELTKQAKFKFKGREYVNTGMRGFLDEEGYFTLTGRDSRFYITSTLNKVYCDHVQKIISMIDIIDQCAVVKKEDENNLYGNVAYVVLKDGIEPTEEIKDYLSTICTDEFKDSDTGERYQLKPYEKPLAFEIIDKIPRTKADKVDYTTLEEKAKLLNVPGEQGKVVVKK